MDAYFFLSYTQCTNFSVKRWSRCLRCNSRNGRCCRCKCSCYCRCSGWHFSFIMRRKLQIKTGIRAGCRSIKKHYGNAVCSILKCAKVCSCYLNIDGCPLSGLPYSLRRSSPMRQSCRRVISSYFSPINPNNNTVVTNYAKRNFY